MSRKNKKNDTETASNSPSPGSNGRVDGASAPATNAVSRKNKLRGGAKNMFSVKSRADSPVRPPYPHILEAGTQSLYASDCGLDASWFATLINMRDGRTTTGNDVRTDRQFCEYGFIPGDAVSRNKMLARRGLQAPLSGKSLSRLGFWNRNGQGGLSSLTDHQDALLYVEKWHYEPSKQFGIWVNMRQQDILISQIYHSQRGLGPYGYAGKDKKVSGLDFTPYERLYNERMAHYDVTRLNIRAEEAYNLTLEDLARASLDLVAPSRDGLAADTWVFEQGIRVNREGYADGLNSVEWGLTSDKDGNVRFLIQPPMDLGDTMVNQTVVRACETAIDALIDGSDLAAPVVGPATLTVDGLPGSFALWGTGGAFRTSNTSQETAEFGMSTSSSQCWFSTLYGNKSSWVTSAQKATLAGTTASLRYHNGRMVPATPSEVDATWLRTNGKYMMKMWCMDALSMRLWMRAISELLPPEYLALGVPMLSEISVTDAPTPGNGWTYSTLVDLINLNGEYSINFNPVNHSDANNGPYGHNSDRTNNWLSAPLTSGTLSDHVDQLSIPFSNLNMPTGIGEATIGLPTLFSLMNPRWAQALWGLDDRLIAKHERVVKVPADRTGSNATLASSNADDEMGHFRLLLARLFGGFTCETTVPLSDVDYGDVETERILGEITADVKTLPASLEGTGANKFGNTFSVAPAAAGKRHEIATGLPTVGAATAAVFANVEWTKLAHSTSGIKFSVSNHSGLLEYDGDVVIEDSLILAALKDEAPMLNNGESGLIKQGTNFVSIIATDVTLKFAKGNPIGTGVITGIQSQATAVADGKEFRCNVKKVEELGHVVLKASDSFTDAKTVIETLHAVSGISTLTGLQKDIVTGVNFAEWSKTADTNTALDGINFSIRLYKGTIAKTQMAAFVADNPSIVVTSEGEVYFHVMEIGMDVQGTAVLALSGMPSTGFDQNIYNVPQVAVNSVGVPTPLLDVVGNPFTPGIFHILHALLGLQLPWMNSLHSNTVTTLVTSPGSFPVSTLGGEARINYDMYHLPVNEDLFYEQRRSEFDAAVLSYSGGRFYPIVLNQAPGYNGYPYIGRLHGFSRDDVQAFNPELLRIHPRVANPFLVDNINLVRVVKEQYVPAVYNRGYSLLTLQLGELYTTLTPDQLLAAQARMVRTGQILR